jgi:hypothetical protein
MSWDAWLIDDRGHEEGSWNYTHNTNRMANAVIDDEFDVQPGEWRTWWARLDGLSGPEGAAMLDRIIRGLQADPARFEAMNPENGWGNYDSFVKVLTEMRNAVPEWPTKWSASG